eukprot:399691-Prorocentrum_lima.AAC.1
MTSSLVGSEMCIRDSLLQEGVAGAGFLCGLAGAHSATKRARVFSLCIQPVSYTHLTLPTICSV